MRDWNEMNVALNIAEEALKTLPGAISEVGRTAYEAGRKDAMSPYARVEVETLRQTIKSLKADVRRKEGFHDQEMRRADRAEAEVRDRQDKLTAAEAKIADLEQQVADWKTWAIFRPTRRCR